MDLVIWIGIIILLVTFWDYLNDKIPLYEIVFYGMIVVGIIYIIIKIVK